MLNMNKMYRCTLLQNVQASPEKPAQFRFWVLIGALSVMGFKSSAGGSDGRLKRMLEINRKARKGQNGQATAMLLKIKPAAKQEDFSRAVSFQKSSHY
ncbi:hypothetical protein Ancab_007826 [Ancistrocladus abbreviatus]